MKHFFLTLCFSLVIGVTTAQENDSIIVLKSQANRIAGLIDIQDLVNEGFDFWKDDFKGHWAGIEVGISGFAFSDYSNYPATDDGFLKNKLMQINVLNINLLQYSTGLQQNRNTFGFITGIGLNLQSYRLDNNTSIKIDQNRKVYPVTLFFESNQKSKLSSVYIDVPLLLEIQIPVGNYANRLYFSGGIIGSKRLETHTKVKYKLDGKREKLKSPGDYSIRDFKVSGSLRMGYRWANIFVNCDLVSFFENRRGPELYPFSFGIKLISF